MNLGSWIILAVVVLICALAIRSIYKDHKSGKSSCGGCHACSTNGGTATPRNCAAADKMVADMERGIGFGGSSCSTNASLRRSSKK